MYGCESWTLTANVENELDGCYTRLLKKATNVHWQHRITNKGLYGDLPAITEKIKTTSQTCRTVCEAFKRRHSNLVLWDPEEREKREEREDDP